MTIEKYHFDDLTKINTAIGLLDDDTLARLRAHDGGGYEVFYAGTWVGKDTLADVLSSWIVRAAPIPVTQDYYPWVQIDKRIQWAGRDKNGGSAWYSCEPALGNCRWVPIAGIFIPIDGVFADYRPGTCDWRDSLQKRPEGV